MSDTFYAKLAFYLSLGFWIPLFNVGLCAVSLYYAFRAMKLCEANPKKYGGLKWAIIAAVISVSALVLTTVGTVVWGFQQVTGVDLLTV